MLSEVTRRLDELSSLTRKNRPLNRLTTVAISIRTMAALSMVGLRGKRDVQQYSEWISQPCRPAMKGFRPGIGPTLVVLLLLPVLVALGFWQLGRGEQKRQLLASYAERRAAEPVALFELLASEDPAFRRVRLHGHFDADHSLLMDNRLHDGKVGVELLQPFLDQASGRWLLVNRGWLPWPDRRTPPVFSTPQQSLSLDAWVYVSPGAAFQLHADPSGAIWPRLITAVAPQALWAELGRSGFDHEVRLESGPGAYLTEWPVVAMGPEKHQAYAVQWFAMALALFALYLYFGWHNTREKRHGNGHESTQHL
ncbi:hypothetical protein PFLCHA0_c00660 [Pseudomonas protegens CHA0]|uniref:SURF1-like protein n=2 Tax=Pseudomonas protegens TaxID=380021 RepID=A0A2C9EE01_PSEPH|nr:hypothetical protein PFLCHA0_c00660 [Pseudomonas protegens CHA0]